MHNSSNHRNAAGVDGRRFKSLSLSCVYPFFVCLVFSVIGRCRAVIWSPLSSRSAVRRSSSCWLNVLLSFVFFFFAILCFFGFFFRVPFYAFSGVCESPCSRPLVAGCSLASELLSNAAALIQHVSSCSALQPLGCEKQLSLTFERQIFSEKIFDVDMKISKEFDLKLVKIKPRRWIFSWRKEGRSRLNIIVRGLIVLHGIRVS